MPPRKRAAPAEDDSTAADSKRSKTTAEADAGSSSSSSSWQTVDDVLVLIPAGSAAAASQDVVGFDIDDTIITPSSGKKFAQSATDWRFWHPSVPAKLQELHAAGRRVVFFSNQGGISKGQTTAAVFTRKLNAVLVQIPGVPVQVYASTTSGKCRKPAVGMWDLFVRLGNKGAEPDHARSTYVGDAAGRQKGWRPGAKKDFSDSDRKFAINLGLEFKTPEELFLGEKPVPFELEGADPRKLPRDGPLYEPVSARLIAAHQELVVMVGYPGSGKSFFSVQELEQKGGYVRVNRDTLKTKEKCVAVADAALAAGKSVVVDNTNPDSEAREPYLELAKRHKVPARAFVMQTTFDEAMHNNQYREVVTNGAHEHVPTLVFHTFRKKFEEPTAAEGFGEVLKTYFRPRFDDPAKEKLFFQWTPL